MNRSFNNNSQQKFALLSGDYNPMHIDSNYARKTMFGNQVVHGINIMMEGLNYWCKKNVKVFHITNAKVVFRKALTLDNSIDFSFKNISTGATRIEAHSNDSLIMKIDFEWNENNNNYVFKKINPPKTQILELKPSTIPNYSDSTDVLLNPSLFQEIYPTLAKYCEFDQMAIFLTTSKIVGMKCPGRRSVYSSLDIDFNSKALEDNKMFYKVSSFDKRFNLLKIDAKTISANIKISAFLRPKSFKQENIDIVKKHIKSDEFSEINALIVGGSRGIGSLTAKILTAGGAGVTITYNKGEIEANELVEELIGTGKKVQRLKLDVLADYSPELLIQLRNKKYTHMYYYATPFIFSGNRKSFSVDLFKKFNLFYVSAFYNLFTHVLTSSLKAVIYPSTVALNEKPLEMKEYILAKTSGEELCLLLSRLHQEIFFYIPRLPRVATDQTMSLANVKNLDPLPELLKHIRKSNSLKSKSL